jgi:hypothetical protein
MQDAAASKRANNLRTGTADVSSIQRQNSIAHCDTVQVPAACSPCIEADGNAADPVIQGAVPATEKQHHRLVRTRNHYVNLAEYHTPAQQLPDVLQASLHAAGVLHLLPCQITICKEAEAAVGMHVHCSATLERSQLLRRPHL